MTTATSRQRLVDAARTVVARAGLEGLTLRAIAREAGVSHGAPLRHFPSLAALLATLSAWGFDQLVAAVDEAVAAPDQPRARHDARSRLARSGRGYVRFALAQPGVFSVMFRSELIDVGDPGYQAAGAASFAQLVDLVAAAQKTGWHAEHPTDRLAAVLWARVHGLAELWIHGGLQSVVDTSDPDALVDFATALDLLD